MGETSRKGAEPGLIGRGLPLVSWLFVSIPAFWGVVVSMRSASYSTFGRDQGIFQYFAWACRQGEALYRDIRDVNGPLTTAVHLWFQRLGGEDEHRFRVLDLLVNVLVFLWIGACLPGLGRPASMGRPSFWWRSLFAVSTCVILSAQYLSHIYWDIAQRETFADWFLIGSLACGFLASGSAPRLRSMIALVLAGACFVTSCFGKPTFPLFLPCLLLALWVDDEIALSKPVRFGFWALGALLGLLTWLGWIGIYGDLRSFLRIAIFEAPVLYRYIWARAVRELFMPEFARIDTVLALSGMLLACALVWTGKLRRRALSIALLPIGALLSLIAQRKGFMYHYHPLGISSRLVALVLVVFLVERAMFMPDKRAMRMGLALVVSLFLGLLGARQVYRSSHWVMAPSLFAIAQTPEGRASEPYFQLYTEGHFYPLEMRKAAKFVEARTRPDERIQVYGMDPYFYFLAKRQSATPYVYAYDLNVTTALAGGTGITPDEEATQKILAMQAEHEADMLARLKQKPPAAFVFLDHSPMTTHWEDAAHDFAVYCPDAAVFLRERYEEAIRFGIVRVYLPKGSAEEEPALPEPAPGSPPSLP